VSCHFHTIAVYLSTSLPPNPCQNPIRFDVYIVVIKGQVASCLYAILLYKKHVSILDAFQTDQKC